MMEAGAEALQRAGYSGVVLSVTPGGTSVTLDSPSAIGCAAARAFPAMMDKMEAGDRDTLLHPGPIGSDDPMGWAAMSPTHRAQHVLHTAPTHLLGIASVLFRQHAGNDRKDAGLRFLADAVVALARQTERAATIQRREQAQRQQAEAAAREAERAARRAKPQPKRKPRPKKKPAPVQEAVS